MRLSPVLALRQFLVLRVRMRIVANVDSMGLVTGMMGAVSPVPADP